MLCARVCVFVCVCVSHYVWQLSQPGRRICESKHKFNCQIQMKSKREKREQKTSQIEINIENKQASQPKKKKNIKKLLYIVYR